MTRSTSVRGHTRTTARGKVPVRQHARTIHNAGRSTRKKADTGLFSARRAFRHLGGKNQYGRRLRRYSKKRIAGYMLIGLLEALAFTLFRGIGLIATMTALGMVLVVMMANGATAKEPKRNGSRGGVASKAKAGKKGGKSPKFGHTSTKASADGYRKPNLKVVKGEE